MRRLIVIALALAVGLSGSSVVAQVGATPETFTGIHRNEGLNGRPETVTITDGRSFIRLSEQEYRAGGYRPAYETLLTRIVRRVPVRNSAPADRD